MLKKERRKSDNSINAGSMADIAFLLLIFFLVTTTIAEDQGILVKLPRWEKTPPPPNEVNPDNVLTILVNGKNELLVEGKEMDVRNLREETKYFISNPQKLTNLPTNPVNAIISLKNDRSTSYETYIGVYNELKGAYRELRDEEGLKLFGKAFEDLPKEKQKEIRKKIPLVISEAEPTDLIKEVQ